MDHSMIWFQSSVSCPEPMKVKVLNHRSDPFAKCDDVLLPSPVGGKPMWIPVEENGVFICQTARHAVAKVIDYARKRLEVEADPDAQARLRGAIKRGNVYMLYRA